MIINDYIKQWCDEAYGIEREDFFIDNAYYVADKQWALGGLKHGAIALLVGVLTAVLGIGDGLWQGIISGLVNLGIMTVCFWFYGIRQYDANSWDTSKGMYLMVGVFLFLTKGRMTETVKLLFAIGTTALFVYLSFVKPIKFIPFARKMRKCFRTEEVREEEKARETYDRWRYSFNADQATHEKRQKEHKTIPEDNGSQEDPKMTEAKKLFEGCIANQQVLKTRYRQLAKQHHPDHGGDTRLFQCIVAVYEEYSKALKE